MKSISFPDMFALTYTKTVSDYDATLSNLKLLLATESGSLYGDPYFGCKLRRFLFEQNSVVLRDLIIDEIYLCIITFMPQLHINRSDIVIKSEKSSIYVTINCINKLDNLPNTYEIQLLDTL